MPTDRSLLRLLAHVTSHLDEDVGLAALAAKAGRSPFALHRRFSGAVGETPKGYVERLRLERAASLLVTGDASVLEIALEVGFQSHEVFTRAFRRHFGLAPTQFRARGLLGDTAVHDLAQLHASHAALTQSVGPCVGLFHSSADPQRNVSMSYDVALATLPEQPILFMRRKVKPAEIAKALAEILGPVFGYAQRSGLAFAGHPFCRYAAWGPQLTIEVGMPVVEARGEGEILAGVLRGGQVAKTTHVGTYESLRDAHAALDSWLEGQKLVADGASWESYVTDPAHHPDPKTWRTDVFLPIGA